MTMLREQIATLWSSMCVPGMMPRRFFEDGTERVTCADLLGGSSLYGRGEELEGRSVLLAAKGQLTTASALIELDGIARRLILCPPDIPLENLPYVIETAEVDGIVSDRALTKFGSPRPMCFSACSRRIGPGSQIVKAQRETEWILLTSGTTGLPKLVAHTLASLTAAIQPRAAEHEKVVWSTFYDIRRYGGLQILLRAALSGASMILSDAEETVGDFLDRAAAAGVTHISGTPSHWRRALMSPAAQLLKPRYIRLSGEAVDQGVLNHLRSAYPDARIVHAFASTEAGVAFEVKDGEAGFPESLLNANPNVEMKIEEGTLHIRSAGNARCYLGENAPRMKTPDGFVDTADTLELRDGRYYFCGRRDGVINVGGLKVYPEEVEAVIGRHPKVQMCLVRPKKSPITGALIIADIVLKEHPDVEIHNLSDVQTDILQFCREVLPAHKVPASIHIVREMPIGDSGKVIRRNA
jgi:acyl-coenzyme A synthetase/AMP-(fatty) acid ligase